MYERYNINGDKTERDELLNNKSRKMLDMFLTLVKIGTFTLGGGYAMIPLVQKEFVENKKWIDDEEFMDIVALSQTIPGALIINSSTYLGYRLFGFSGAVVACLGSMLPAVIIILLVAIFFNQIKDNEMVETIFKGVRPAVVSLILYSVIKLSKSVSRNLRNYIWVAVSAISIAFFSLNPIIIIVVSGLLGYILFKGKETS